MLPGESLLEAFCFLGRDDLDSLQLVSGQFRDVIGREEGKRLAIRWIRSATIGSEEKDNGKFWWLPSGMVVRRSHRRGDGDRWRHCQSTVRFKALLRNSRCDFVVVDFGGFVNIPKLYECLAQCDTTVDMFYFGAICASSGPILKTLRCFKSIERLMVCAQRLENSKRFDKTFFAELASKGIRSAFYCGDLDIRGAPVSDAAHVAFCLAEPSAGGHRHIADWDLRWDGDDFPRPVGREIFKQLKKQAAAMDASGPYEFTFKIEGVDAPDVKELAGYEQEDGTYFIDDLPNGVQLSVDFDEDDQLSVDFDEDEDDDAEDADLRTDVFVRVRKPI